MIELALNIHVAPAGEPLPTDATTPLSDQFRHVGVGRARIQQHQDDVTFGLIARYVPSKPELAITWQTRPHGWDTDNDCVIVGDGRDNHGGPVRLVIFHAHHIEHDLRSHKRTTTAQLRPTGDDGCAAMWYYPAGALT